VTVQNDVAVQNNGAAAQPDVNTAAEPLNLPIGSSRRQSKPHTPPMDHSARCAAPATPLLVTALFSFMFVPFLSLLLFVTLP